VREAGGNPPIVIDSDDLVSSPAATMAAYCAAAGLPFIADSLHWEPGHRPEWERSSRYHETTALSSGFVAPAQPDRHELEEHPEIALFTQRHTPFYEELRRHRLVVAD
jgi:hypothetical protein